MISGLISTMSGLISFLQKYITDIVMPFLGTTCMNRLWNVLWYNWCYADILRPGFTREEVEAKDDHSVCVHCEWCEPVIIGNMVCDLRVTSNSAPVQE